MTRLLLLSGAILLFTAVGIYSHTRRPKRSEQLSDDLVKWMLWLVLPPCVYVNLAHFDLTSSAGLGLLIGFGCLAAGGLIAWFLAVRVLKLPDRSAGAMICATVIANTGYFGLPATLIVFGSTATAGAAAWDALLSGSATFLAGFAIGAYYGEAAGAGAGERLRSFFTRNPVLWVLPFALLTPSSAIPGWALDASHVAFVALLPIGFYVLGVNLSYGNSESPVGSLAVPVAVTSALRLLLIPALFLGICAIVGDIPHSYVIQAAAPTGINALIVATLFDLDRRLTATTIAVTTIAAILAVLTLGVIA